MPENSWPESDSYNDLEPINSLLSDLSDTLIEEEIDESPSPFQRGLKGRRRKAAIALTMIWGGTVGLHFISWGAWFVLGLTTLMGLHVVRILLTRPLPLPEPLNSDDPEDYPYVSVLVAAKNEEAVIGSLVEDLCNLDYPASRYDLWIIDDNSSDRTALVLKQLSQEYQQLHLICRAPNAGGGKSGALNQVWSKTKGDIIAVFDADAQVPKDLLRQVVPLFRREQVGAVQVRKAITNAVANLWTRGQATEMVLDSYLQQQRIAVGGLGELRGNGQFVRRSALEHCRGWNEETITDDLDLTLRLHLNQWDIDFLLYPAVGEEGVIRTMGLWHQRNRWAEGGYQRYLDYWRLIARHRLGFRKRFDLLAFLMIQYVLPTTAMPDLLMAIARNTPPILMPMTSLTVTFSMLGMFIGLRRVQAAEQGAIGPRKQMALMAGSLFYILFGTIYMLHWLPVVASTTARMSIRPKRLKWVKTVHHGAVDAS